MQKYNYFYHSNYIDRTNEVMTIIKWNIYVFKNINHGDILLLH